MKDGSCEYMWNIICQLNIHRLTYKAASRSTGWDGIKVLFDGFEASCLRYYNTVKLVWSVKIKQWNA